MSKVVFAGISWLCSGNVINDDGICVFAGMEP
jgi:hypothetical protein